MKVRKAIAVVPLMAVAVLPAAVLAQSASAAVATKTTMTVTNPQGTTPGKIVVTGKIRPTTGTGTPTGTCTFLVDKTVVGTKAVNSRGNCSLTTHVKLGTHTIRIRYGGSATYAASSASMTVDVTR